MANEKRVRVLNAFGLLNAALLAGTTTITFASAPANMPTIDSTKHAAIILEPDTTNEEIVYLTAYTAGALTGTILRGQEGTAAVPHASGMVWAHGPTKRDFSAGRLGFSKRTAGNLIVGSSYQGAVTNDGATAYYKCDETSGTTLTDIINGYNCTLSGAPTWAVTGLVNDGGTAAQLTGQTGTFPNPAALQTALLSVELWTRETAGTGGSFQGIIARANSWGLMADSGIIKYMNAAQGMVSSGVALATTGAHHLVITMDLSGAANGVKIYYDGSLILTTTATGSPALSGSIRLAMDGYPDPAYQGIFDSIAIYAGQILTAGQVSTHFAAGSAGTAGTTGFVTLNSGLDVPLSAFAGDIVEVGLDLLTETGTGDIFFDAASIVSGSPVNYWGGAGGNTDYGITGWAAAAAGAALQGSAMRQLVAGDISGGVCTVRAMARSTAVRTVDATVARPLQFWAKNHGPQEAA